MEGESCSCDIVSEQSAGFCLSDCCYQTLDCEGVFIANIHVSLAGSDGDCRYEHSLKDTVRVAFQYASVHVRSWISLICVADYISVPIVLRTGRPFDPRGKTAAPAPSQPGFFDYLDDLGSIHFMKCLYECGISPLDNVFLYAVRVNIPAIPQGNFYLFAVKRDIFQKGDAFKGFHFGKGIGDILQYAPGITHLSQYPFLFEMGLLVIFYGVKNFILSNIFVNHPRLAGFKYFNQRFEFAETDTSGLADPDAVVTGKFLQGLRI